MSAYIVDRAHIDYLICAAMYMETRCQGLKMTWYPAGRRQELTGENATQVGQMLWDENFRSVKYRYEDMPLDDLGGYCGESKYRFGGRGAFEKYDPVQVIKACNCLDYQSCEHPEWKASEAHAFINALIARAICEIPGYEEAEWGAPRTGVRV